MTTPTEVHDQENKPGRIGESLGKSAHAGEDELKRARWLFGIMLVLTILILGLMIYMHRGEYCRSVPDACSEVVAVPDVDAESDAQTEGEQSDQTSENMEAEDEPAQWMGKFREPPWQWYDWVLAALVGVLLYCIATVASFYHKAFKYYDSRPGVKEGGEVDSAAVPEALAEGNTPSVNSVSVDPTAEETDSEKPKFISFTPWYISTIVKAPILSVVILVLLTNIDLEFAGVNFNFKDLDAQVLLMLAFVLGFYSRVAREQLSVLVKAIFGTAYSKAEETFAIEPGKVELAFSGDCAFKTSPDTEVIWLASAGTIDEKSGYFVAPKEAEGGVDRHVLITAVPTDPRIPRTVAEVTVKAYSIGGAATIQFGASESYSVNPKPPSTVNWSIHEPAVGAIDDKGTLVAPDKATAQGVTSITIVAKSADGTATYATLQIALADPGGGE